MVGVGEVRDSILLANQKMQEGIVTLQHASQVLEEAQQILAAAIQGSNQEEVQQAVTALAEVLQNIRGSQDMVHATMRDTEGYAGRL